ncbi:protein SPMIP7-like [Dysidea avara]|uniref:protein SPMIP7-like n=1 Tax=Dysidea avara TaxID=196820 RepID=UPI00332471CD
MAETAVHPRPHFSTFLQSDASAGGDALSYYRHKQYLRKNKTAILQARAGNLPTIQKPSAPLEVKGEQAIPKLSPLTQKSPTSVKFEESAEPLVKPVNHYRSLTARPAGQFVRTDQPRLVKSASTHGRRSSWSVGDISLVQTPRPKTAGNCTHDYKVMQSNALPQLEAAPKQLLPEQPPCKLGWITESTSENRTSSEVARDEKTKHKRSQTEPAVRVAAAADSGEAAQTNKLSLTGADSMTSINDLKPGEVEQLAKAYVYGTSTQRGYNEVGWHNKLPGPLPLPSTALEALPDQVSLRFTMKRYDAEPAQWQAIGTVWDYTQTRNCSYHKGPQAISYSSPNRKSQQIPGYSGHVGGGMDEVDDLNVEYKPTVVVRTHQPWHTKISRTSNIPGYTGCVHWSNRLPAHSNMPKPEPTSTSRVHRALPLEENGSPFIRTGVLSKTVILTSPYNPFNKVEH